MWHFFPGIFRAGVGAGGTTKPYGNNRNRKLLFDALNQYSLSRGSIDTWGRAAVRRLRIFHDKLTPVDAHTWEDVLWSLEGPIVALGPLQSGGQRTTQER